MDKLGDWRRTHFSTEITARMNGQDVIVMGWVEDIRELGGLTFVTIRDREGIVQVTCSKKELAPDLFERLRNIPRQSAVAIRGRARAQPMAPRGIEVIPEGGRLLGEAKHPLPLDPTGRVPADLDVRLNSRVLDLRRPQQLAIFKIRHHALLAIRSFFAERGFLEVQTPKIIVAGAEGGSTLFQVNYFDRRAFLAQSPQLYKEQLTAVFDKVYEVGTYFRAEKSHTRRHLNEYTSVDFEEAFADCCSAMSLLEDMMEAIHAQVSSSCQAELDLLGVNLPRLARPFEKLRYAELIETLKESGVDVKPGEDIPTAGERKLGELYEGYYFITDWPTKIKPFYIKAGDDPVYSESFDLMCGGLEIASGGTRIHEKEALLDRILGLGLNPDSFSEHLKVFDWGMPPHAGAGIGLERIVMGITGTENIRECILYPRDRERLTP